MKLCYVPLFCGGRLLVGLYSVRPFEERVIIDEKICNSAIVSLQDYGQNGDLCPYIPSTLELFQSCLRMMLNADKGKEGYQGIVTAVTNSVQTQAEEYLLATGFKPVIKTSKIVNGRKCTTWIGDYLNDIYPILSKVPNYTGIKQNAPKFAQAENQIRNSSQSSPGINYSITS